MNSRFRILGRLDSAARTQEGTVTISPSSIRAAVVGRRGDGLSALCAANGLPVGALLPGALLPGGTPHVFDKNLTLGYSLVR